MGNTLLSYEQITRQEEIRTYIRQADAALAAIGYTEHSFAHVTYVAARAGEILQALGCDARTAELARIAGYMHDIGNIVNRVDHAQSGAVMAFRILDKLGMDAAEVAQIISAIGNSRQRQLRCHGAALDLRAEAKEITLELIIDTQESTAMDYFEIFLSRMLMCRKAAQFLGLSFKLRINRMTM